MVLEVEVIKATDKKGAANGDLNSDAVNLVYLLYPHLELRTSRGKARMLGYTIGACY